MSRTVAAPALAAGILGLALTASARQQQPATQQPPVFRATTDIIRVDVTVLGPDGKPVHGLTREDFTLLEDGEPQEILGFGEVNIPDASGGPAWLHDARPDVRTALDGRVFVFLLDDAQTPYKIETKSWIETVRRVTAEVIDRMGPQDIAAVLCTYDKRCDQDFTNDPVRLKTAIAKFNPKDAYIAGRVSAGMAQSVAKYLRTEPGRRRSIIYVTPRMPERPRNWPPSLAATGGGRGGREGGDAQAGGWAGDTAITQQQMIRTFQEAMRAGITVYGLNLAGLRPIALPGGDDLLAGPAPDSATAGRFSTPPRSLATETGGFIVSKPEELIAGVTQIITETGSYYLLGFEPPPRKETGYDMLGEFREIEVRVNKPGVTVKTHRGYISVDPPKPEANPPPAATAALQGVLPKIDLPLSVAMAPFAVPGEAEALLAIAIGVREPARTEQAIEKLDVQARSFTPGGDARASVAQRVDAVLPAGGGEIQFDVIAELRLKPGVYAMRFSADSTALGESGSVYADVEIPDFAKAPLSLSGVLLQITPEPWAIFATDALKTTVPVAPSTRRTFTRRQKVDAFVRVYQGGKGRAQPVRFAVTILDSASAVVYERASTLEPTLFDDTRSADVTVAVPVDDLPAGLYLLKIESLAGAASARRDVIFRVE